MTQSRPEPHIPADQRRAYEHILDQLRRDGHIRMETIARMVDPTPAREVAQALLEFGALIFMFNQDRFDLTPLGQYWLTQHDLIDGPWVNPQPIRDLYNNHTGGKVTDLEAALEQSLIRARASRAQHPARGTR